MTSTPHTVDPALATPESRLTQPAPAEISPTETSPSELSRLVDLRLPFDTAFDPDDPTLYAVQSEQSDGTAGGVRLHEITSGDDPYQMLWLALASVIETRLEFHSVALVTTGVMSRLDDGDGERRRVRVVTVVNDSGTAVTARCDDGEVLHFDEGGDGALPVAMRAWWRAARGERSGMPTRR
jgi:hypothetical protein